MNLKYLYVGFIFYLQYQINQCKSDSITYISTERPAVYWYDAKTFKNFTLLSKRWNRQDPRYYVEVYVHTLVTATNNFKLDFYFYQFLTNRYKPSFVEMHFKLCDMIQSDAIFGYAMRKAGGDRDCPFPPGVYDMKNMTIAYVPKGFPFNKGRIYCNVSLTEGGVTRHVLRMSIDMEGVYDLKNMSIPYVPKGFPFTKGRIYCNVTIIEGGSSKALGAGSIDMEIKVAKIISI